MAEKKPKFTSPRGLLVYPRLQKPDTKYVKEGEYHTRVEFDRNNEDHAEWLDDLEAKAKAAFAAGKKELQAKIKAEKNGTKKGKLTKALKELSCHSPIEDVLDEDGEPSGKVTINFKLKAHVALKSGDSWDQKPALFAGKKPYKGPTIGGGTEARISYEIIEFCTPGTGLAGISLRLKGVKVIKLVEFVAGGSADSFFDDDDDCEYDPDEYEGTDDSDDSDDVSDDDDAGDDDDDF